MLDPSYIRSIRDGIINGNIEANNQEALPDGLVGLYDRELFPPTMKYQERKETLNFFLVFAIAQKEITADFASSILGDEWFNLHNDDESKEEKRLQKVNDLIQQHSKRLSSAGGGKYRLYHERFRLYILQKVSEQDIAQFNDKFITLCETALKITTEKDIQEKESYALEFISTHYFMSAMQGDTECLNKEHASALKKYAYDQQFWERQIKASKGFEWSKSMLNQMMSWASKFNEDDEVIECALNKVDLYHQEQNDSPRIVQLVADGDIETALERIEKYGGEDKEGLQRMFILYMLCMMELTLLDSKDKDHSKSCIEMILKHFDEHIPANKPDLINWNDFFPSYLMFLMACEWAVMGLDYLILYKRTNDWESDWIIEKVPFSDLQFEILTKCAVERNDEMQKNFAQAWAKQGRIREVLEIASRVASNLNKSIVFNKISVELAIQGKVEDATNATQEALKYAKAIDNESDKARMLLDISSSISVQGRVKEAESVLLDATKSANDIRDVYLKSGLLLNISTELSKQGKAAEAASVIQDVLAMHYGVDKCCVFMDIATELALQGKNEEAESAMQEARTYARTMANDSAKSSALRYIAIEMAALGKVEEAVILMREALNLPRDTNSEGAKNSELKQISIDLSKLGMTEEALACAQSITSDEFKSRGLKEISTELAKQGKFGEALKFAAFIGEERVKILTLKDICSEMTKKGNLDEAHECASRIHDFKAKGSILKDISKELLKNGQQLEAAFVLQSALLYARGIRFESARGKALKEVSIEMAKQGKAKEAIAYSRGIYAEPYRSSAMRAICSELVKKGMIDEALESAQGISYSDMRSSALKEISFAYAKDGNSEQAISNAQSINNESDRNSALKNISTELAKLGKFDDALATAQSISYESEKNSALNEISKELAKQGRKNEALDYAQDINDLYWRSIALMDISTELSKMGLLDDSAAVFEKALECARGISLKSYKSRALKYISTELFKQGKAEESYALIQEALKFVYESIDEILNASVHEEICIELARQGKFKEAIESALCISNKSNKLRALEYIYTELVKQGKAEEALAYANFISDEYWKSAVLNIISTELAKQSKAEKAEQTDYLKSHVDSTTPINANKEQILAAFIFCKNDIESMEKLLQHHALHELFFRYSSNEKIERLNRTLNIQWAIDIKNQLPN